MVLVVHGATSKGSRELLGSKLGITPAAASADTLKAR